MPDRHQPSGAFVVMARAARVRGRLGLLLLGATLGVAAAPACEPMLRVNGTVRDRGGRGLDGVAVLLRAEGRGPHPATTDNEGTFHVSIVGAEHALVSFSKDGYLPTEIEVKSKTPPLSIVLDSAGGGPKP